MIMRIHVILLIYFCARASPGLYHARGSLHDILGPVGPHYPIEHQGTKHEILKYIESANFDVTPILYKLSRGRYRSVEDEMVAALIEVRKRLPESCAFKEKVSKLIVYQILKKYFDEQSDPDFSSGEMCMGDMNPPKYYARDMEDLLNLLEKVRRLEESCDCGCDDYDKISEDSPERGGSRRSFDSAYQVSTTTYAPYRKKYPLPYAGLHQKSYTGSQTTVKNISPVKENCDDHTVFVPVFLPTPKETTTANPLGITRKVIKNPYKNMRKYIESQVKSQTSLPRVHYKYPFNQVSKESKKPLNPFLSNVTPVSNAMTEQYEKYDSSESLSIEHDSKKHASDQSYSTESELYADEYDENISGPHTPSTIYKLPTIVEDRVPLKSTKVPVTAENTSSDQFDATMEILTFNPESDNTMTPTQQLVDHNVSEMSSESSSQSSEYAYTDESNESVTFSKKRPQSVEDIILAQSYPLPIPKRPVSVSYTSSESPQSVSSSSQSSISGMHVSSYGSPTSTEENVGSTDGTTEYFGSKEDYTLDYDSRESETTFDHGPQTSFSKHMSPPKRIVISKKPEIHVQESTDSFSRGESSESVALSEEYEYYTKPSADIHPPHRSVDVNPVQYVPTVQMPAHNEKSLSYDYESEESQEYKKIQSSSPNIPKYVSKPSLAPPRLKSTLKVIQTQEFMTTPADREYQGNEALEYQDSVSVERPPWPPTSEENLSSSLVTEDSEEHYKTYKKVLDKKKINRITLPEGNNGNNSKFQTSTERPDYVERVTAPNVYVEDVLYKNYVYKTLMDILPQPETQADYIKYIRVKHTLMNNPAPTKRLEIEDSNKASLLKLILQTTLMKGVDAETNDAIQYYMKFLKAHPTPTPTLEVPDKSFAEMLPSPKTEQEMSYYNVLKVQLNKMRDTLKYVEHKGSDNELENLKKLLAFLYYREDSVEIKHAIEYYMRDKLGLANIPEFTYMPLLALLPVPTDNVSQMHYNVMAKFMKDDRIILMLEFIDPTHFENKEELFKLLSTEVLNSGIDEEIKNAFKFYFGELKLIRIQLLTRKEIRKKFDVTEILLDTLEVDDFSIENKQAFTIFFDYISQPESESLQDFDGWFHVSTEGEFTKAMFQYLIKLDAVPENIKGAIIKLIPLVKMDGKGAKAI